jgi:hypothetical protein
VGSGGETDERSPPVKRRAAITVHGGVHSANPAAGAMSVNESPLLRYRSVTPPAQH